MSKKLRVLFAVSLLLLATAPAKAAQVQWNLSNVQSTSCTGSVGNGAALCDAFGPEKVTGSLDYDTSTNTIISFDLRTTGLATSFTKPGPGGFFFPNSLTLTDGTNLALENPAFPGNNLTGPPLVEVGLSIPALSALSGLSDITLGSSSFAAFPFSIGLSNFPNYALSGELVMAGGVSNVPLPASLPLFAIACAILCSVAFRRRDRLNGMQQ